MQISTSHTNVSNILAKNNYKPFSKMAILTENLIYFLFVILFEIKCLLIHIKWSLPTIGEYLIQNSAFNFHTYLKISIYGIYSLKQTNEY